MGAGKVRCTADRLCWRFFGFKTFEKVCVGLGWNPASYSEAGGQRLKRESENRKGGVRWSYVEVRGPDHD